MKRLWLNDSDSEIEYARTLRKLNEDPSEPEDYFKKNIGCISSEKLSNLQPLFVQYRGNTVRGVLFYLMMDSIRKKTKTMVEETVNDSITIKVVTLGETNQKPFIPSIDNIDCLESVHSIKEEFFQYIEESKGEIDLKINGDFLCFLGILSTNIIIQLDKTTDDLSTLNFLDLRVVCDLRFVNLIYKEKVLSAPVNNFIGDHFFFIGDLCIYEDFYKLHPKCMDFLKQLSVKLKKLSSPGYVLVRIKKHYEMKIKIKEQDMEENRLVWDLFNSLKAEEITLILKAIDRWTTYKEFVINLNIEREFIFKFNDQSIFSSILIIGELDISKKQSVVFETINSLDKIVNPFIIISDEKEKSIFLELIKKNLYSAFFLSIKIGTSLKITKKQNQKALLIDLVLFSTECFSFLYEILFFFNEIRIKSKGNEDIKYLKFSQRNLNFLNELVSQLGINNDFKLGFNKSENTLLINWKPNEFIGTPRKVLFLHQLHLGDNNFNILQEIDEIILLKVILPGYNLKKVADTSSCEERLGQLMQNIKIPNVRLFVTKNQCSRMRYSYDEKILFKAFKNCKTRLLMLEIVLNNYGNMENFIVNALNIHSDNTIKALSFKDCESFQIKVDYYEFSESFLIKIYNYKYGQNLLNGQGIHAYLKKLRALNSMTSDTTNFCRLILINAVQADYLFQINLAFPLDIAFVVTFTAIQRNLLQLEIESKFKSINDLFEISKNLPFLTNFKNRKQSPNSTPKNIFLKSIVQKRMSLVLCAKYLGRRLNSVFKRKALISHILEHFIE